MKHQDQPTRKSILITGTSRGIGRLSASSLAAAGHRVVAGMRDPDGRNSEAAHALRSGSNDPAVRGTIEVLELDVTSEGSVARAVEQAQRAAPLDVLINNAGVMPVGVTEAFTEAQVQQCFDVNVLGAIRVARAVLPAMRARRSGLLIHLSSTAGRLAIPFFGVYCASKWALEAYAESLHYELAGQGVESILVEPGGHATDLVKTAPRPQARSRQAAYGPLAGGGERLLAMFSNLFEARDPSTDAQNVADTLVQLVERGSRPLRTTVGNDMGLAAINEAARQTQAALLDQLEPQYRDPG